MMIGGAFGLALAAYGGWILFSHQAPALTARSFRTVRDAGYYHLLFGTALSLVVLGAGFTRSMLTTACTGLAVGLVGLALVRFRPRPRRSSREK